MQPASTSYLATLARLVELFGQPGVSVDQIRETLQLLVARAQERGLTLTAAEEHDAGEFGFLLDGEPLVGLDVTTVVALRSRLRGHEIRRLGIARHAPAAELARLVRWIARAAPDGPPGAAAAGNRRALLMQPFWHVSVAFAGEDEAGDAAAAPDVATRVVRRYLTQLLDASEPAALNRALVGLDTLVDAYAESGDAAALAAALVGLAEAETQLQNWPEQSRAVVARGIALVRARYEQLGVACLAAKRLAEIAPPARTALRDAIGRVGLAGERALVAHLMAAEHAGTRRIYYDALVALRGGIPLLLDALHHKQWYIARNAACLLGEMRATEADVALATVLENAEPRVREAAAVALTKLATPLARQVLAERLSDPHPGVRLAAVQGATECCDESAPDSSPGAGWTPGRGGATDALVATSGVAAPLIEALDDESSADVRLCILHALGRLGTPDAVRKLRQAVLPQRERGSSYRIAALEALVCAQGRYAQPVVDAMQHDGDREVQRTATRLAALLPLRKSPR